MRHLLSKRSVVVVIAAFAYAASGMAAYYSEGTKNTRTVQSLGTGQVWRTPDKAKVSDDVRAKAAAYKLTQQLTCTNFGFELGYWPTINGILVTREGKSPSPAPIIGPEAFWKMQLVHNSDTIGNAKNVYGMPSSTTDGFETDGGATDLWGATLTDIIVRSSSFGVAYWLDWKTDEGAGDEEIDLVQITVYFTNPSGQSLSQTRTGTIQR